jgi:hypothetical protein
MKKKIMTTKNSLKIPLVLLFRSIDIDTDYMKETVHSHLCGENMSFTQQLLNNEQTVTLHRTKTPYPNGVAFFTHYHDDNEDTLQNIFYPLGDALSTTLADIPLDPLNSAWMLTTARGSYIHNKCLCIINGMRMGPMSIQDFKERWGWMIDKQ